jgi:NADH:ubiquinone oxidoreductase subunit F (NADH-binding)
MTAAQWRATTPASGFAPVPRSGDQASPAYPFTASLIDSAAHFAVDDRRLLQGPAPDDAHAHLARYGPRPPAVGSTGGELLAAIAEAELTGRGGAGFPVAAKWRTALQAQARGQVVVVGNGAESEALSAKDTALLQLRPHLVLDGLICAAEALDAEFAVLWLHEGASATYEAITQAIQEREETGRNQLQVQISWGPDSYLTGESSAIVQGLEGGPALPMFTRAPAAHSGAKGRPTVIHNVETLARIALIARRIARPAGGTLLTIPSGRTLTVRELPASTTVAHAVLPVTTEWTTHQEPQAILVGGYGGAWARWDEVADLGLNELDGRPTRRTSRQSALAHRRPSLSTGILAAIPQESCGVAETAAIADYLARSSARQCGPCLYGTRALADGLQRIASGNGKRADADRLRRTTTLVKGRGACGLPDGLVSLVRSALTVFADDIEGHLRRRGCRHNAGHRVLHVPDAAAGRT